MWLLKNGEVAEKRGKVGCHQWPHRSTVGPLAVVHCDAGCDLVVFDTASEFPSCRFHCTPSLPMKSKAPAIPGPASCGAAGKGPVGNLNSATLLLSPFTSSQTTHASDYRTFSVQRRHTFFSQLSQSFVFAALNFGLRPEKPFVAQGVTYSDVVWKRESSWISILVLIYSATVIDLALGPLQIVFQTKKRKMVIDVNCLVWWVRLCEWKDPAFWN